MNDESSIFHVEIAGPIADIHKLSSWVVVVIIVFSFAVKYTVLTMHNRFLRSMSSLSTPIKKKWKEDHQQRVSYSTSVQSWRVEFQEDLHWETPQSNKRDKRKRVHTPNHEAKSALKPTCWFKGLENLCLIKHNSNSYVHHTMGCWKRLFHWEGGTTWNYFLLQSAH